jgi:hemolysin III
VQANDRPISARTMARLSPTEFEEAIKPRLRGWSHAIAALGAIGMTALMLAATVHDLPRFLSVLVFGMSLTTLYIVSAIYHIGTWRGRRATVLLALDHANIFLLIAGTYTPICVNVLSGWLRPTALIGIWILAAVGITSSVVTLHVPRWALTALYLGMGWGSLLLLPSVTQALPVAATLLLIGGGLLYTIGAVIYIFGHPNPLPYLFGFHEIFHLCVVGGSAATAVMIWIWVVPFPRI